MKKRRKTSASTSFSIKKNKYVTVVFVFQEYYNDITEANAAVQKGKVSGVMHFGSNFSEALLSRLDVSLATVNTSEYLADITASQINIFLDMSGTYTHAEVI